MVLFHLLLLLIPVSHEDQNCPGWCGNPVEEIKLWTDNPHVWRCELPSVVVLPCADEAYISCRRLDDLGGDLYLMLFADSPDDIGIDPDFLAKGRVDTLRTVIECKDGKWTPPNSTTQMTHILCDQYIINKTKAEESPFKPLPWKPEVVTSTIGTTNEENKSNEDEATSSSFTPTGKEMFVEKSESLETTAHNSTSTTIVDSAGPEIITATNSTGMEMTTDSTDLLETIRMSSSTSSTSSVGTSSPKVPRATTTIFLGSTTTSHSEKEEFKSITGITLKHTTLAMATTPMPSFTTSSTKSFPTARTTSQATKEVTVAKNEPNTKKVTITITTPKPAEQSDMIIQKTTSTYSPDSTQPEKAPVPKIAQKPIALPITSISILLSTTVSSASTAKLTTTLPKILVTNKVKTTTGQQYVEPIMSVAPEIKIGSPGPLPINQATKKTTTSMSNSVFLGSAAPPNGAQFFEITTPSSAATVKSNIPQVVSVQVPTKPATGSTSTNTTKRSKTPIPSAAEFEPDPILVLPPTIIDQLPTSQQSSRHTPSAADIIPLEPDPYDGVIEPVVILEEKLTIPSRMSRSGGTKEKRLRFRKKIVPPTAKISRKIQVQKVTRRRTILPSPQRRRHNRIKKKERKSRKRQHVEKTS